MLIGKDLLEYHSNLISAYLLNDTRQKIIHMNVGTKKIKFDI